jgi:hypothetical protein
MDFALLQGGVHWVQSGSLDLDLLSDVASSGLTIAQTFQDNLFSNVGRSWDNFIRSGQVWALIIGFVIGYIFRGFSAY